MCTTCIYLPIGTRFVALLIKEKITCTRTRTVVYLEWDTNFDVMHKQESLRYYCRSYAYGLYAN